MIQTLKVSVGQYSSPGRKEINQDFYGFCAPQEPQLSAKGIAIALADGISSSDVSHVASEAATITQRLKPGRSRPLQSESWARSIRGCLRKLNRVHIVTKKTVATFAH